MQQLNYHHLQYFYAIAREGSIVSAARTLHLSPQTLSGQLATFEEYLGKRLFDRIGKRLLLNDTGKLVYSYAEDIFSLGGELQRVMANDTFGQQLTFVVGVVDVIPKILSFDLLSPIMSSNSSLHLVSLEGELDSLLADLAVNKIDLVISDRPLPPGTAVKAYNHLLGASGLTFFGDASLARRLKSNFPNSLHGEPILAPGDKSSLKINLMSWFDSIDVTPRVVAEFDDSALMKVFGQAGHGVFCTPSTIEEHVLKQYNVKVIGRTRDVTEQFYAISPERKIKNPLVTEVLSTAQALFSGT